MFAFDKPLVWLIILVMVMLIFGAGKLPEIGKSLGKSIKEFKEETTTTTTATGQAGAAPLALVAPSQVVTPAAKAEGLVDIEARLATVQPLATAGQAGETTVITSPVVQVSQVS